MVGDWFRFRYTIDGKEIVHTFRISRIEDELGEYYVWGEGFGRMCYPKRLEPIPLTPEIFKSIGFKDYDSEPFCDGFDIYWLNRDGYSINTQDLHLHFVHELQHALRLCGIDKTIVL